MKFFRPLYLLIFFSLILSNCKVKQNNPNVNLANVVPEDANYLEEETDSVENTHVELPYKEDYINDKTLRYEDRVYHKNIKTAQLYVKGSQRNFPVLYLNDGKQLELHFDDLSKQYHTYTYDFIHCNADWTPSGLMTQEYIDGFFNGFIEDYKYSFNTLFPYIHYSLKFPNQEIKFKMSGNYLLVVHNNGNEDDIILTKRFYVVNERLSLKPKINIATLSKYRDYKQEIDFTIEHPGYLIQDPYNDLKVVISQNRRFDNAITDLKPLFVKTPELVYNYEKENLFDGNNEFRFFDAKDLRYQAMNVDGIQIMNGKTHVYILAEEPRSFLRYYFQNDLNGQRYIKRDESDDFHTSADYILTHFTLKRATPVVNGEVYVFGELSDWQFKDEFKMDYVEVEEEYRTTALIKQGYYNYAYVVLPEGQTKGDMSVIEGTHSETENDYYFFVYHRQNGEIYDRLVNFTYSKGNNLD